MGELAYLEIWAETSQYIYANYRAAWEKQESLAHEDMVDFFSKIQEMSGDDSAFALDIQHIQDPDNIGHELACLSLSYMISKAGNYLELDLEDIRDHSFVPEEGSSVDYYARIEYDPTTWFDQDNVLLGNLSGRLFTLAYNGILDALGFCVRGTYLKDPQTAD